VANEPITHQVTVVIPALNEEQTIAPLLDALLGGTRPPDEIVVSDGGSTDSTRDIVGRYVERGVRLIEGPGGISENRNAAIEAASHELIACTDAGCIPDSTWLERLVEPLEAGAEWAGGLSRPARTSRLQKLIGLAMMPSPDEIDLDHFVPGGASQAFTRDAWRRAGGFPEGMRAGEDTVFGQRIKDLGIRPTVVPDAQVTWQAPRSLGEMMSKAFLWGRADGSVGTNSTSYLKVFLVWVGGAVAGLVFPIMRLPRLGMAAIAGVLGASAWMTRRKHRALDDPLGSVALPVTHALRTGSQGVGWALGYLARPERAPLPTLGRMLGSRAWMKAKQTVRPYIPDTLLARLRPGRTRPVGTSRNNVDILIADRSEIDVWLASTPDTYRVGVEPTRLVSHDQTVIVRPETASSETRDRLAAAVRGDVLAAALATTSPPGGDLSHEPAIDPFAVAVDPDALKVPLPSDVSTLQHLIRQAGLHQAVIPVTGLDPQPSRRPISDPGAAVILGTVPMRDVGGGSRGAQMAHELIARGYHVTYLNLFDSDEKQDLGLRYVHGELDEIAATGFDLDRFLSRLQTQTRLAIVELPHPRYLDMIESLSGAGFAVAYDLMDDWSDTALGGWGYSATIEDQIARRCDALIASAPSLVARLEGLSDRPVTLVPNAVNTRLFHPGKLTRPDDLPTGDGPVLEYHGSLYGDWFDWKALERTARAHPDARLVIIGDDRRHPPMPDNVHFLGLKPQHLLPAYLAHSDVAMIPFEVSDTTHAVSPLKVFEYLAMGVPVASVPLEPLEGLDGVHTDPDLSKAVDAALDADRPDPALVAAAHGWGERMTRLFEALDLELQQDPDATPIHITQRPVIHWPPDQRRL
jgi:hypothetical protein